MSSTSRKRLNRGRKKNLDWVKIPIDSHTTLVVRLEELFMITLLIPLLFYTPPIGALLLMWTNIITTEEWGQYHWALGVHGLIKGAPGLFRWFKPPNNCDQTLMLVLIERCPTSIRMPRRRPTNTLMWTEKGNKPKSSVAEPGTGARM